MVKYTDNCVPDYNSFGNEFLDGRLVEPGYNFPDFRFNDVYEETIRLGRPLTDEEFKDFFVNKEDLILV